MVTFPARRASFSSIVYEALREKIILMEIPPGARLSENILAGTLNVSRSPVREALKLLEQERLVMTIPQRGTFVTKIVPKEVLDACDMRLLLEEWMLKKLEAGVAHIDRDVVARLLAEHETIDGAHELSRSLDLDNMFHKTLLESTDNQQAIRLYLQVITVMIRVRTWNIRRLDTLQKGMDEHRLLYQAICERNWELAGNVILCHVDAVRKCLRRLEEENPDFCSDDGIIQEIGGLDCLAGRI